jgi:Restriction endonuclease
VIPEATLKGYLLEEVLAWMLRGSGYRLLVHERQDPEELSMAGNGLCVKGRGADHQVDVLGEFAFTPAFSLPVRLFLEAKFTRQPCRLPVVRNAHGVIHDINENFTHGPGHRLRKRYRYVYALFSTSGFTQNAQDFALAQQISLVDLSGASFFWLRDPIETAAADLVAAQRQHRVDRFPVNWTRGQLRRLLGTWPDILDSEVGYPETSAHRFSQAAQPVLRTLANGLEESQEKELLLGFPSAPFILPLAASNADEFLRYASQHPDHVIRLRRSGQGTAAEWTAFPADDPEAYRLTFNLPDKLEEWIAQTEEQRTARTRQVKQALLADIVVYRVHGDDLRTFQLHYQPEGFRQGRNAYRA